MNKEPWSRLSKNQPSSVILTRTQLRSFRWIHCSRFESWWATAAWDCGTPSIVDLGMDMLLTKGAGDGEQKEEPKKVVSPVNIGEVEKADKSIGDAVKEQLLRGEPINGRSIQSLPQWAIGRTEGLLSPKLLTLVIIHKNGSVLLGMKKRGFGKGYYNGFGGKVEKGETIDEAAARELQEESGVTPVDMSKRGILTFHFDNDPVAWEVHVYHVSEVVGDPYETEEMEPRWFKESEIPYETMWSDDIIWYPEFLKGHHFKGTFYFENTTTLVAHSLQVIST